MGPVVVGWDGMGRVGCVGGGVGGGVGWVVVGVVGW